MGNGKREAKVRNEKVPRERKVTAGIANGSRKGTEKKRKKQECRKVAFRVFSP